MPGLTASHWTSRIGAAWDALPDERVRKSATIGVSLAINAILVLALTAFASNGGKLPGMQPITLELVSSVVPKVPTALPTPPAPAPAPKPATPRPRAAAPAAPSTGPAAPALTLPDAAKGNEPGVETIPAIVGPTSPAVPKGLQRYLEADPCVDPGKRKLHPECKSDLRAATDAIPERQARADRADRLVEVAKDLGVYNNCQSSHLGCAAPPNRTLTGAAVPHGSMGQNNPMGAGGPTGMPRTDMVRENGYHVDPGFGD